MTVSGRSSVTEHDGIKFILCSILTDVALNHRTDENSDSLDKDIAVILRRFDARGLHYIASVLPTLGSALDKALCDGFFMIPPQFSKKGNTTLPRLLYTLWSKIFDPSGTLLSDPDISAIVDLRFLTKAFYKYEADYDEATVVKAIATFKDTDLSLPKELPSKGPLSAILDVARTLITEVLGSPPSYFIPRHSSGSVSTGEKPWQKTRGLISIPQYKILGGLRNFYTYPGTSFYSDTRVQRSVLHQPIAKLVDVPKDSRGPRLICEEPATQQFLQQGIKDWLYDRIEQHPITKGFVNFTDQTINQKLAIIGSSVERDTVTLDMKEASDRIATCLVERLFPAEWYALFEAVRTELVELPNSELFAIEKFAPMGSALCFPIESLVHWALSCATYMLQGYSSELVLKSVYVYGDDIVLRGLPPVSLFKVFPYYGLKFNEVKSCYTGRFRESCGVDAYSGVDISTLKFKKCIPISSGNPELFVAWVEYSNLAFERGYYTVAQAIQKWLEGWYVFPTVRPNSDVIGFTSKRPFGFQSKLGISQNLKPSIASAIDDRQPVYRCLALTPKRPQEEWVCDRSRYFETQLELARRQKGSNVDDPCNISVSYAIKYQVKYKKVWTKNVVAFNPA